MKKKFLTLILMASVSASMLAGCGNAAETASSGNVVTDETESADVADNAAEEAEPECVHEWNDATFARPKTCALCGETEGEPKQSYFDEHGENVPDAPVECTVDAVIYNPDNPEEYQMVTDGTWEQIDCYSEPAEEEGYQLIHLELCASSQLYYDAAQNISYHSFLTDNAIYDWYTGRLFPTRAMSDDDAFDYGITLNIDGVSYDVSFTKDLRGEFGEWTLDDNGDATQSAIAHNVYTFKVPNGYDGLVYAAIPRNEYIELDTETVYGTGTEDGESASGTDEENVYYAFDEGHYTDGTKFFRINRQEDSPITSGANDATDKSSARAVIDDGREQGSIGDSGLPYYRLGFSPDDFTIGGLSVYDVNSAEDMYEAVDLPDSAEFKGEGWYKQLNADMGKVFFNLHISSHDMGLAQYTDNSEKNAISFQSSSIDEHTIADADFMESPIVPRKTSWNEAVDALGIRDLLDAMGVDGIPFENTDKFAFESQYSENSYCYTKWNSDSNQYRIRIGWIDEDGKEVCLTMWLGDGNDVVSLMEISRTH